MKLWKKLALALVALVFVTQAPFACRRYRLGQLRERINSVNASRAPADPQDPYADHAGVLHIHSALGGHSEGTFEEILRAAKANGLAFVLMTEHPSKYLDTAQATPRGTHDGVLFVGGSEVVAEGGERLLVLPGARVPEPAPPVRELVRQFKADGRLAFAAYPEDWRDLSVGGLDGVEVYNLFTNAKRINYPLLLFDALWSYRSHADLLFATFYERPDENLRRWDELTRNDAGSRPVAVAGNDAHQNVGVNLQFSSGKPVFRLQLDPYERSFRLLRTHVLLQRGASLRQETLLDALALGHCYVGFDLFGDSTGFRFTAESVSERKIMGDEIRLDGLVRLTAVAPAPARLVFFKDGRVIQEEREALRKDLDVTEPGVYRVEAYLDRLGESFGRRPWVISNPIYVR
ncbi:MAG TPA: hypothetical protein VGV38_19625 [Pyrinomonadaceae bacterium]|nr:hypothetical protein [Pyrinomonadaceae bacterium]